MGLGAPGVGSLELTLELFEDGLPNHERTHHKLRTLAFSGPGIVDTTYNKRSRLVVYIDEDLDGRLGRDVLNRLDQADSEPFQRSEDDASLLLINRDAEIVPLMHGTDITAVSLISICVLLTLAVRATRSNSQTKADWPQKDQRRPHLSRVIVLRWVGKEDEWWERSNSLVRSSKSEPVLI